MEKADWLLLFVLSMIWGGSYLFNAVAVESLPPLTVVSLRLLTGALFLNLAARAKGVPLSRERRIWKAYLVMGLFNNIIPFTLIVYGQTMIAGGLASILNATTPLFTMLIAHRFTGDERFSAGKLAALATGFIGVVLIIGTDALSGLGSRIAAQMLVLCASVSYAAAGVFGRRFRELGSSPLATATGQVTASSLLLLPVALLVDSPWRLPFPPPEALFAVAGLGLLSTVLAYIIYFRILERAGATNLLLVTFLIPIHATILGIVFRGEFLKAEHLFGMGIIFASLVMINRKQAPARGK